MSTPFDRIYLKLKERVDIMAADQQASRDTQSGPQCRCGKPMITAKVLNDREVDYCKDCRIALPKLGTV